MKSEVYCVPEARQLDIIPTEVADWRLKSLEMLEASNVDRRSIV
jgi:hypothetical protein